MAFTVILLPAVTQWHFWGNWFHPYKSSVINYKVNYLLTIADKTRKCTGGKIAKICVYTCFQAQLDFFLLLLNRVSQLDLERQRAPWMSKWLGSAACDFLLTLAEPGSLSCYQTIPIGELEEDNGRRYCVWDCKCNHAGVMRNAFPSLQLHELRNEKAARMKSTGGIPNHIRHHPNIRCSTQ